MNDAIVTDAEVMWAAEFMATALKEMLNDGAEITLPAEIQGEFFFRIEKDAEECLSLDPTAIEQEYNRLQGVANALDKDQNTDLHHALKQIDSSLVYWTGDGADGFDLQMSRISTFIGHQQALVLEVLKVLAGLLFAAAQARSDYRDFAKAMVDAAKTVRAGIDAANEEFLIGLGADVVKSAINGISDPKSLLANAATFLVGRAGENSRASVEGDGKMAVIASYNQNRDRLREHRQAAVEFLTSELNKIEDRWGAERPELFKPLPPKNSIDIEGPLFDYGHFASINNSSSRIEGRVNAELTKRRSSQGTAADADGAITNALNPPGSP